MVDDLVFELFAILIVLPVVAVILFGLQRLLGARWDPRIIASAALGATVVLVLAYLIAT